MNTSITKQQFQDFRTTFRQLARDKQISSSDIMLYNFIRDLPLNRGFTDVTNHVKLNHGMHPKLRQQQTVYVLHYQIRYNKLRSQFVEILGAEVLNQIQQLLEEYRKEIR